MSSKSDRSTSAEPEGQNVLNILSIVIPAHNEALGIRRAIEEIIRVIDSCGANTWEIIVVDDGSHDGTFDQLRLLAKENARIKGIQFSRNFGKEAALLAGLKSARGDVVITIDADLQHPPKLIPDMVRMWRDGVKVVDAVKRKRDKDSVFARTRAYVFNTFLSWLGGINVNNASDFKLLDRLIVDVIVNKLPEKQRFYRGLSDWVGYPHKSIPFDVERRVDGEGKWSLWGLVVLATTAIVSFTSAPLRIVTFLGLFTLVFAFFITLDTLWSRFQGEAVSGFATMIITLLIIGSFIMISLGIVGEYIAKIYDEIKDRPTFLVEEKIGFDEK